MFSGIPLSALGVFVYSEGDVRMGGRGERGTYAPAWALKVMWSSVMVSSGSPMMLGRLMVKLGLSGWVRKVEGWWVGEKRGSQDDVLRRRRGRKRRKK